MRQCDICSQIGRDMAAHSLARMLETKDHCEVLRSEYFVAYPSIGALVPGHLVLFPVRHMLRFADMDSAQDGDFRTIDVRLRDMVRSIFGQEVHRFEHGSDLEGRAVPCTVAHAHVHYLPLEMGKLLLPQHVSWSRTLKEPVELVGDVGSNEYLYYAPPSGSAWLTVGIDNTIASQLLRRCVADALGQSDVWNWRDHPRPEVVRRTLEAFRAGEDRRSSQHISGGCPVGC